LPETRVIDLHFAADNMGLHSLVFTQLCFKFEPSESKTKTPEVALIVLQLQMMQAYVPCLFNTIMHNQFQVLSVYLSLQPAYSTEYYY